MKSKIRKVPRVVISVILAISMLVTSSLAASIISGVSLGRTNLSDEPVVKEGVVEESNGYDDEMVGASADDGDNEVVGAAADDNEVGATDMNTVGDTTFYIHWGTSNQRNSMTNTVKISNGTANITSSGNTYFIINTSSTFSYGMSSLITNSTEVTNNLGGSSSWADAEKINDGSEYYIVKYWYSNSSSEVQISYDGNNVTVAPAADNVCDSVTLVTNRNTLTQENPTFKLTATANTVASALNGKSLVYTFTDSNNETIGTVSSSTGTAELDNLTQSMRERKYKVTVSYTGYVSKTSDLVTVINSTVAEPLFKLIGKINNDWTNGTLINGVDPSYGANIYYLEVSVTTTDTNATLNRFRLKDNTNKQFASLDSQAINDPAHGWGGKQHNLGINDIHFTTSELGVTGAGSDNYFQINPTKAGTYRIYVDQTSTTAPKVWVTTVDNDIFITKETGFNSYVTDQDGKEVVTSENVANFTSEANTGFVGYKIGEIWSADPITTEMPFMLSSKYGVDYELEYAIRTDLCTGVTLTQQHVMVGDPENGEYAQIFKIKSNTVTCTDNVVRGTFNIILHIDKDKKEIYATSCFNQTDIAMKAAEDSDTVTYYFAKTVDDKDYDGSGADTIKILYWNNSIDNTTTSDGNTNYFSKKVVPRCGVATGTPAKSDGTTSNTAGNDTKIYVDLTNPISYTVPQSGGDLQYDKKAYGDLYFSVPFYIYKVEIPSWATSFSWANKDDFPIWQYEKKWGFPGVVLNPNRVYCFYGWGDGNARRYYTIGARLDKSLWTANTKKNEDEDAKFIKYEKTNLIRFNGDLDASESKSDLNPDMNAKLVDEYVKRGITNEMYFGNFSKQYEDSEIPTFSNTKQPVNWKIWNNLAQRSNQGDKYRGNCSFFASVWDLSGGVLDLSRKTGIGSYYLNDTYQKADLPFFDYDTLSVENNGIATAVYQNVDFPFYKSTYNGITSYSYDSLSDYNREFNTTTKKYEYINKIATLNGMQGYKPFSDQSESFANEFLVKFYMTESGKLKADNGAAQDITFNFSGDDDVWVYIDGVKVLDLGGAHMISAGSINLSDMKTYYRTPARTNFDKNLNACDESYATNPDFMRTVDLKKLFEIYGINFNNKDATTQHTLQMFYMERGQNESNCSISFNLPQNSGLRIQNEIDTSNVNAGLLDATLTAADKDYFSYYLENSVADNGKVTLAQTLAGGSIPSKATAAQQSSFYSADPKFPVNNSEAVYRKDPSGQLLLASGITNGAASNMNISLSNNYFTVNNLNYKLTDSYAKGTIDDTLSGRTASSSNGATLNLLYGQSATFNSMITPHTYLVIKQQNQLYYPSTVNNTITKGAAVDDGVADADKRNASRFYSTTYTITDDSANKEIGKAASENNMEEDVLAHSSNDNDGFYFSNYSNTTDTTENVAATYKFVNQPNVGEIDITKVIDSGTADPSLKASFWFTVQFKDVFGVANSLVGKSDEYEDYDVKYRVYSSDGSYVERTYNTTHGILLRHGQTAKILGVPAGTKYKVVEQTRSGYELTKITKDSYRSGELKKSKVFTDSSEFTQIADIDYLSKNDSGQYLADFNFYNKPIALKVILKYYDRFVKPGGETEISKEPSSYTYIVSNWSDLPATDKDGNDITWRTTDSEDYNIYINTAQLISYVSGLANIDNVLCNYTFWTSNAVARTDMREKRYRYDNSGAEVKYKDSDQRGYLANHTNYIGVPVTGDDVGNEWVTYKDSSGTKIDYTIGDRADTITEANYKDLTTIEAWAFNDPKTYTLKYYAPEINNGALDSNSVLTYAADYSTPAIGAAPETIVGTKLSGEFNKLYNIRMGGKYLPQIKEDMTQEEKDAEEAKAGHLNRPSNYLANYFTKPADMGYTGTYPETPAAFDYQYDENNTCAYKFAYWASDIKGKNKITSDYHYGYRITQTMDIYPVYVKSDAVDPGVSLVLESGVTDVRTDSYDVIRRFNTYFNVIGAEANDSNLTGKDLTVAYVRLGKDKNGNNETAKSTAISKANIDFNKLKETYLARLSELATWGQSANTIYIDVTSEDNTDTRRGTAYKYSISFTDSSDRGTAVLNNKNRVLVSHSFADELFQTDKAMENMLIYGAVKYGDNWKLAENYLYYEKGELK